MSRWTTTGAAAIAIASFACVGPSAEDADGSGDAVTLDTASRDAQKQYDANMSFALGYESRCGAPSGDRRRVIVVGFGRFKSGSTMVSDNASGRIVSTLVPDARYPGAPKSVKGVYPPEREVSVARAVRALPGYGEVDVCAMIVPVSWDLAAVLLAKEIDAFDPTLVMMNGVAAARQAVWIELGAVNLAKGSYDGSGELRPVIPEGEQRAKIVEEASADEMLLGNLLSFRAVEASAREVLARRAADRDGRERFDAIVTGVVLAGFPRESGTYVCNNLSYVTGWLMDHPGREVDVMRASVPRQDVPSSIRIGFAADRHAAARVFVHWPRDLADRHREAAAEMMSAMIVAQLRALDAGDAPVRGDNAWADPSVQGGDFY